jgi:hypothetical protein
MLIKKIASIYTHRFSTLVISLGAILFFLGGSERGDATKNKTIGLDMNHQCKFIFTDCFLKFTVSKNT